MLEIVTPTLPKRGPCTCAETSSDKSFRWHAVACIFSTRRQAKTSDLLVFAHLPICGMLQAKAKRQRHVYVGKTYRSNHEAKIREIILAP